MAIKIWQKIKATDIHDIYRVAGICMVSDHVLGPLVNSRAVFLLFTCLSLPGTWHLNSFTSLFLRLSNPSRLPLSSCKPCDVVYISFVSPFNFEKNFPKSKEIRTDDSNFKVCNVLPKIQFEILFFFPLVWGKLEFVSVALWKVFKDNWVSKLVI